MTTAPEDSPLDIWEAERDRWASRECPTCHGTGYVADSYGEAVPCDECGYEDAVAEAIVGEAGSPF